MNRIIKEHLESVKFLQQYAISGGPNNRRRASFVIQRNTQTAQTGGKRMPRFRSAVMPRVYK